MQWVSKKLGHTSQNAPSSHLMPGGAPSVQYMQLPFHCLVGSLHSFKITSWQVLCVERICGILASPVSWIPSDNNYKHTESLPYATAHVAADCTWVKRSSHRSRRSMVLQKLPSLLYTCLHYVWQAFLQIWDYFLLNSCPHYRLFDGGSHYAVLESV